MDDLPLLKDHSYITQALYFIDHEFFEYFLILYVQKISNYCKTISSKYNVEIEILSFWRKNSFYEKLGGQIKFFDVQVLT